MPSGQMGMSQMGHICHNIGGRRKREVSPTPVGATLWEHIEEEKVALKPPKHDISSDQ